MPDKTSKGQIIPKYYYNYNDVTYCSSEFEDYICRLTLSDQSLVIEREEYAKDVTCLFDIPLRDIIRFDFINEKQQKESSLRTVRTNIIAILTFALFWIGSFSNGSKRPDILMITFRDSKRTDMKLIFNMMEFGDAGLTNKYRQLTYSDETSYN